MYYVGLFTTVDGDFHLWGERNFNTTSSPNDISCTNLLRFLGWMTKTISIDEPTYYRYQARPVFKGLLKNNGFSYHLYKMLSTVPNETTYCSCIFLVVQYTHDRCHQQDHNIIIHISYPYLRARCRAHMHRLFE